MPIAKVTSKGQVTIPKKVRDELKLRPGDKVDFQIDDGAVRLLPVNLRVEDVAGMLSHRARPDGPVSVEEMDEAIARGFREGRL